VQIGVLRVSHALPLGVMMTPDLVHGDERALEYRHDGERLLLADKRHRRGASF